MSAIGQQLHAALAKSRALMNGSKGLKMPELGLSTY